MAVVILDFQRKLAIDRDRLERHALLGLRSIRKSSADLTIVLVNDRRMRALNATYRNKNRTTDVLSFEPGPTIPGTTARSRFLGEIVIALPRAFSQAKKLGITLDDEVSNLLIHGLCHLLGYDHEKGDREALEMKRAEEKMARAILKNEPGEGAATSISGKIPDALLKGGIQN